MLFKFIYEDEEFKISNDDIFEVEEKVEKRGNKWCVVHGHPKKGPRDKPKGSIIKCFPTKKQAIAMHQAILISQKNDSNKEVNSLKNLYRDSMSYLIDEVTESKDGVKKVKIRIVTEGITVMKDKDYTKGALENAVENGVFNNAPMFLNHTTISEEVNRPERDINDKVAEIKTTEFKERNDVGYIIGNAVIHGSPTYDAKSLFEWFKNMKESKTPIEISQHSYLEGHEGEKGGYPLLVVEDIVAVKSVDFVTKANAGGFLETLESQKTQKEEGDEKIMNLKELKEKHPELVLELKAEGKEAERIKELEADGKKKDEKIEKMEKEAKEKELADKKESLVKEAEKLIDAEKKLPDTAKNKLKEEIDKDSITEETESLKEVTEKRIAKEIEYLKGLGKKGVEVFANEENSETEEAEEDMDVTLDKIKEVKDSKKDKK